MPPHLLTKFKYKNIITTNPNVIVFLQDIVIKEIVNKANRNLLDSLI